MVYSEMTVSPCEIWFKTWHEGNRTEIKENIMKIINIHFLKTSFENFLKKTIFKNLSCLIY